MAAESELRSIKLPEHDEMLRRLKSVQTDDHLERGFYTLLLRRAGESMNGPGIALMFVLAFGQYTARVSQEVVVFLSLAIPNYVDALVDDEMVRNDALQVLREAGFSST